MQRLVPLALALALVACESGVDTPSEQSRAALVEDQHAYHVGVLAYLYGYPLVDAFRRDHNRKLADTDAALPALDPMRSLGFFEILNLQLKANPPGPDAALLMAQFDAIGVGPNRSFKDATLTPAAKRGLERAIRDARVMLDAASPGGDSLLEKAAAYRAQQEERASAGNSTAAGSR